MLKSHQSILPCGNGIFPVVQLPLPGKELHLHLNGLHICWRRSPTPINKKGPASQLEASPDKRQDKVKTHLTDADA
jgi:hypothetical protein